MKVIVFIKIKQMKYKDLPPDIKAIAYQRANEQNYKPTEDTDLLSGKDTFNWAKTKEGCDIWSKVNNGNFDSFYKFHNIIPLYNENNLPEQFKIVEVSNDGINWYKRIFCYYDPTRHDTYKWYAKCIDDEALAAFFAFCRPASEIKSQIINNSIDDNIYSENNLPEKYQVVEVSQDNIRWQKRLFLTYNKHYSIAPFISYCEKLKVVHNWKYCRCVIPLTITKEEAEKELSKIKNQTVVITVK